MHTRKDSTESQSKHRRSVGSEQRGYRTKKSKSAATGRTRGQGAARQGSRRAKPSVSRAKSKGARDGGPRARRSGVAGAGRSKATKRKARGNPSRTRASASKRVGQRSGGSRAPRSGRRYGPRASEKVGEVMHEMKHGQLRRGRSGKKVTDRRQAIAIALSEARREGAKVPEPPAKRKRSAG